MPVSGISKPSAGRRSATGGGGLADAPATAGEVYARSGGSWASPFAVVRAALGATSDFVGRSADDRSRDRISFRDFGLAPADNTVLGCLRRKRGGRDGQAILVRGYARLRDGGGGWYHWDAGADEADDGGRVVQPGFGTAGAPAVGRWVMEWEGSWVSCRRWGAIPDGETECGVPLGKALSSGIPILVVRPEAGINSDDFPKQFYSCNFPIIATKQFTALWDHAQVQFNTSGANANNYPFIKEVYGSSIVDSEHRACFPCDEISKSMCFGVCNFRTELGRRPLVDTKFVLFSQTKGEAAGGGMYWSGMVRARRFGCVHYQPPGDIQVGWTRSYFTNQELEENFRNIGQFAGNLDDVNWGNIQFSNGVAPNYMKGASLTLDEVFLVGRVTTARFQLPIKGDFNSLEQMRTVAVSAADANAGLVTIDLPASRGRHNLRPGDPLILSANAPSQNESNPWTGEVFRREVAAVSANTVTLDVSAGSGKPGPLGFTYSGARSLFVLPGWYTGGTAANPVIGVHRHTHAAKDGDTVLEMIDADHKVRAGDIVVLAEEASDVIRQGVRVETVNGRDLTISPAIDMEIAASGAGKRLFMYLPDSSGGFCLEDSCLRIKDMYTEDTFGGRIGGGVLFELVGGKPILTVNNWKNARKQSTFAARIPIFNNSVSGSVVIQNMGVDQGINTGAKTPAPLSRLVDSFVFHPDIWRSDFQRTARQFYARPAWPRYQMERTGFRSFRAGGVALPGGAFTMGLGAPVRIVRGTCAAGPADLRGFAVGERLVLRNASGVVQDWFGTVQRTVLDRGRPTDPNLNRIEIGNWKSDLPSSGTLTGETTGAVVTLAANGIGSVGGSSNSPNFGGTVMTAANLMRPFSNDDSFEICWGDGPEFGGILRREVQETDLLDLAARLNDADALIEVESGEPQGTLTVATRGFSAVGVARTEKAATARNLVGSWPEAGDTLDWSGGGGGSSKIVRVHRPLKDPSDQTTYRLPDGRRVVPRGPQRGAGWALEGGRLLGDPGADISAPDGWNWAAAQGGRAWALRTAANASPNVGVAPSTVLFRSLRLRAGALGSLEEGEWAHDPSDGGSIVVRLPADFDPNGLRAYELRYVP